MRLDRVVRIVVGLVIVSMVFVGPRTPLGWWGLFPLLTGIVESRAHHAPAHVVLYPTQVDRAKALLAVTC